MTKGSVQWDCMKKLQLIMVEKSAQSQVNAVLDENGNTLNSHGDVRMYKMATPFPAGLMQKLIQLPVRYHLLTTLSQGML